MLRTSLKWKGLLTHISISMHSLRISPNHETKERSINKPFLALFCLSMKQAIKRAPHPVFTPSSNETANPQGGKGWHNSPVYSIETRSFVPPQVSPIFLAHCRLARQEVWQYRNSLFMNTSFPQPTHESAILSSVSPQLSSFAFFATFWLMLSFLLISFNGKLWRKQNHHRLIKKITSTDDVYF